MNAVIREKVRVDARHAISITGPRLVLGKGVEMIVRATKAANAPIPSLWELASTLTVDAPADYPVDF